MKKEERLERDKKRLADMKVHEDELRQQGYRYIAGIDEVGRGPLAGPVYAACVLLPADFDVLGVYDSKKLSAGKRKELSEIIKERALAYGIGIADNKEIDDINILEATKLAMERSVEMAEDALRDRLSDGADRSSDTDEDKKEIAGGINSSARGHIIDILLVDALKLELGIPCEAIVKGDEKSLSIAAASILAKVARDAYMEELDSEYPGYGFAGNKGYGTAAHYDGLRKLGISDIHRRSFLKKFEKNTYTNHDTKSVDNGKPEEKIQDVKRADATFERKDMGKKVYAVKKGRIPGIYMTWEDCKVQVDGFAGAEYKSFADPADAMSYLGLTGDVKGPGGAGAAASEPKLPTGVRAYVDGSYDSASGRFSCGVVILETDEDGNTEQTELKAVFDDAGAALQRNVAGEIMGAKTAIDYCLSNDINEITIYHDYEGVGKWADNLWKANNPLTQGYKQFVSEARQSMVIKFEKVKAHAGNKYNELADRLAKDALRT